MSPSDNSRTETGFRLELTFQCDSAHAHQRQYKTQTIYNSAFLQRDRLESGQQYYMTIRSVLQKGHHCMPVCLELTNDIISRTQGEKWGSWWHLMPPGWGKSMRNGHCHSHNIITSEEWLWKEPVSPFGDGSSCLISFSSGCLRMLTQGFFLLFFSSFFLALVST